MDYHKHPLSPWGTPPLPSSSNHPGIKPGTVPDPFTNNLISQFGPPTHPVPPQQLSRTISTPFPAQGWHPPTHCTLYPTCYKSRYHPEPPQQSSWTIPTAFQSKGDTYQPTHLLPKLVKQAPLRPEETLTHPSHHPHPATKTRYRPGTPSSPTHPVRKPGTVPDPFIHLYRTWCKSRYCSGSPL